MTSRAANEDGALRELQRALDAFLATHSTTVATFLVDHHLDHASTLSEKENPLATETTVQRDVKRLQCLSAAITATRQRRGPASVGTVATFLLSWCDQIDPSRGSFATEPAASSANASVLAPVASWLTATLLSTVFQEAPPSWNGHVSSAVEELVALLVTSCFLAFQRSWQAQDAKHRRARTKSAGTLFSYFRKAKPAKRGKAVDALTTCLACTIEASGVWGHVWGLVACWAPDVARILLQKELVTQAAAWNATKGTGDGGRHPYLRHLMHLRLGLTPSIHAPSAALTTRLLEAVKWLRVLMPLLLKPHRSHVRSACAHVVAWLLHRELVALPEADLKALYTLSASEWSRCISNLHAVALRLTEWAKKKTRGRTQQHVEAASWALRTVVLALAPNDIYTRYWRDDVLALLRLQSHLNQDAVANGVTAYHVLPSLDVSFTYMMQRHVIVRTSRPSTNGIPSETEVMEIINTTQAWAFFSLPRLRPQSFGTATSSTFKTFTTLAVPALQHVTQAMASYNLTYTIESHVRRLIAESIGVGDPQKLVGLEALVHLVSPCALDKERLASLHVDRTDVMAHKAMLGELVSRVLLECKTRFGHHVLTELASVQPLTDDRHAVDTRDVDDEKHWSNPTHAVAVATFGAAVSLLPVFYAHVSWSDEQKVGLLVRAIVNANASVRRRAHEALLALVTVPERLESEPLLPTADEVIRALVEYILQLDVSPSPTVSDAAGAMTILRTLRVLLAPSTAPSLRWASARAQAQAIVHVEALAVYLLVRGEDHREAEQLLRQAAVATLQVAHAVRSKSCHDCTHVPVHQLPVDRPSVWTLVHELESEFQTAFFTYVSEAPNGIQPSSVLDRLIRDTSVRHSFRWSLALARILQRVQKHAPEVTALLYHPVAEHVQKLEPVLSVTPCSGDSPSNQRALSRWRNFALLAMLAAGPSVQPPVSSIPDAGQVAPSTPVASLVRQLACYLRSTHGGQRQAAAFVLGHAGATALATVLDVLARLQTEAVGMAGKDDREALENEGQRPPKLPKKRAREVQHARAAQVRLQWAIGRCYRLLIESPTWEESEVETTEPALDACLCRAVGIHVTHMVATFEQEELTNRASSHETVVMRSRSSSTNDTSELFLMQLDFIALYHSLLLQPTTGSPSSLPVSNQHIATMLFTWCGPFDQTLAHTSLSGQFHAGFLAPDKEAYSQWMHYCDVSTARDGDILFPKLWIETLAPLHYQNDTSRRVLQYFLCHRAFSLFATMVRQRHEVDELDQWLEACFHLDTVQLDYLNDLQHFAHRALHAQLDWPATSTRFHHVMHRCLEKATYPLTRATAPERRVARQYLKVLGASRNALAFAMSLLHCLQHERGAVHDKDKVALAVRLLHVLVLHVGTPQEEASTAQDHRPVVLEIVATLVNQSSTDCDEEEAAALCWSLQDSIPSSLASRRMHVTVSALLASHFSVLSLPMSLTLFHSLSSLSLDSLMQVTQQHQMLAAVLPWLAEVSLAPSNAASRQPSDLLDVLYHVTATHRVVCRDQVEHAWLTLAFARNERDNRNVHAIVTFLYQQALGSHVPRETARTVMGALCRWEDAAIDVLHTLVAVTKHDAMDKTTACQQRAAVVALASDASSHLVQCQLHSDVPALTLHLIHVALATLFWIQERASIDDQETRDLRQHCHVLLHSLFPLLQVPRHRLQAAFTAIQAATRPCSVDKNKTHRAAFVNALHTLTTALSTSESTCWSEVCVHEIACAVAPEASVPRRPASSVGLRFALVAYTHVAQSFQGDVLLSVLTLLRQTLSTSVCTDPSTSLACACLAFIARHVDTMPDAKLVLYPQIYWVALALLTHCRQGPDARARPRWTIHAKALKVLSRLWQRTPFIAHTIVHDVIRATRPASWHRETMHTSVVMEIVRSVYASESIASRARALEMLHQAVLVVPCTILGVSRLQHVIICTLSLVPALIVSATTEDQGWNDLVMLWQHCAMAATLPMIAWLHAWRDKKTRYDVAATFVPVFVPTLHALERHEHGPQSLDGFTLSLHVLTACLPSPGKASTPPAPSPATALHEQRSELVFELLEALCQEGVRRNLTRPPVPELHATLARHLQSPRSESQWQMTMRVVTWLAEGTLQPEKALVKDTATLVQGHGTLNTQLDTRHVH